MKFDQLIREGRDTDAVRLFARQYYDGGKMGYTRMLLLIRVADELDELKADRQDVPDNPIRAEAAERAVGELITQVVKLYHCPPISKRIYCQSSTKETRVEECTVCWREWAMKEGK